MESFFVSMVAVMLGEIGDKTQLVALLIAARFKRPLPIIAGIFVATLANHALAAVGGVWIARSVPAGVLRWTLGLSFLAIAAGGLKPNKIEEKEPRPSEYGVFALTVIAFFFAEIGDKTQLATIALAAKYRTIAPVIAGTTLGILVADAPAVWLGTTVGEKLPLRLIRGLAALIFGALGVAVLAGWSV